jgi:hypothetical protein
MKNNTKSIKSTKTSVKSDAAVAKQSKTTVKPNETYESRFDDDHVCGQECAMIKHERRNAIVGSLLATSVLINLFFFVALVMVVSDHNVAQAIGAAIFSM